VPRPQLYPTDDILDSARSLILERGAAAATVGAIAEASGAPVGSLYHRFGSLDELLGRLWVRAVRRSLVHFERASVGEAPMDVAVGAALAVYDFCAENPADGRLLLSMRRQDLVSRPLSQELLDQIDDLNAPVERLMTQLARDLYGRATKANLDRVTLALFDLPVGAVRRPLVSGQPLTEARRSALADAVRAALQGC
jgi:AcrR family transcriptional regulator